MSQESILLTLNSDKLEDPVGLHNRTITLQAALNGSSSVRATPVTAFEPEKQDQEKKGDLMLLYTLALAFVNTGAAKVLIDALRATFASAHNCKLTATLNIKGRKIEITGDNLTRGDVESLVDKINFELRAA